MPQADQQTYVNYTVTAQDGSQTSVKYKSEKQLEDARAEASKSGATIEVTKQQTFELTTASSIDEILSVVPNEKVALSYFNYGLALAQHNVKRELMSDDDWQPVDGAYSLINDVQTEKEKRVADPTTAAKRSLKALFAKMNPGAPEPTDAEIATVLAQFAGQATQTA